MPEDRFLEALAAWDALRAGEATGAHYKVAMDVLAGIGGHVLPPSIKRVAWRPVLSVHSAG
jgi:hypothetical protein